jgi:hypothetical protein
MPRAHPPRQRRNHLAYRRRDPRLLALLAIRDHPNVDGHRPQTLVGRVRRYPLERPTPPRREQRQPALPAACADVRARSGGSVIGGHRDTARRTPDEPARSARVDR